MSGNRRELAGPLGRCFKRRAKLCFFPIAFAVRGFARNVGDRRSGFARVGHQDGLARDARLSSTKAESWILGEAAGENKVRRILRLLFHRSQKKTGHRRSDRQEISTARCRLPRNRLKERKRTPAAWRGRRTT